MQQCAHFARVYVCPPLGLAREGIEFPENAVYTRSTSCNRVFPAGAARELG